LKERGKEGRGAKRGKDAHHQPREKQGKVKKKKRKRGVCKTKGPIIVERGG